MMADYQALVVTETDGQVQAGLENVNDQLADGDVRIKVAYSSLNYKDMLAMQAKGGVIRDYPKIPGIDLSGTVVESLDDRYRVGQSVLVTGYQLGTQHNGGLAEYARVPADWIVPLPKQLSLQPAMTYGTAGFTAGLSIAALLNAGMTVTNQPRIVVTGASGGVGSIALAILKHLGFQRLTAVIHQPHQAEMVTGLGATAVLLADDLQVPGILAKQRFEFALDTVGGTVAAALLPQLALHGAMTLCGNAGGITLQTTVMPFILRGVSVLGIDSVTATHDERLAIWQHLATDWRVDDALVVNQVPLSEVLPVIAQLKAGQHLGRTIVKL